VFEISKTYAFEAAHSLPFLPESHKCHHLHGHSYKVTIKLKSEMLNSNHMVTDFGDLDAYMDPIIKELDHQNLNDHFPCTTSECLALEIFNKLRPGVGWRLCEVEVKETDKTGAKFVSHAVQS